VRGSLQLAIGICPSRLDPERNRFEESLRIFRG
jgi:hypothetical protein